HGIVDEDADFGLFGVVLEVAPAGLWGDPEDVVGEVFVAVLDDAVAVLLFPGVILAGGVGGEALQFLPLLLERVGDVLEEDEAEDDVLVLRGVHVAAELVSGLPEFLFEPQARAVVLFGVRLPGAGPGGLPARHSPPFQAAKPRSIATIRG